MIRIAVFYLVQIIITLLAIRRGGAPERIVGLALLSATIGTTLIPFEPHQTFHGINWYALYIDGVLLAVLLVIAARADRYWPLWLAALQVVTIGIHGVRAYDPFFLPIVYARLAGDIAYPMLALLLVGIVRHDRRSGDADWSPFKW
ncbi:hypothetical protein [Sphingomonas sp. R86520]|uniref:hypothetical protein n=1 Tax=Sphingomonas sp. R86520 TaxID=3093859 RepID=UPI0036D3B66F